MDVADALLCRGARDAFDQESGAAVIRPSGQDLQRLADNPLEFKDRASFGLNEQAVFFGRAVRVIRRRTNQSILSSVASQRRTILPGEFESDPHGMLDGSEDSTPSRQEAPRQPHSLPTKLDL